MAAALQRAGLATLLFDLLTPAEESDRRRVFGIDPMTLRLVDVTAWAGRRPHSAGPAVGYFGARTGASQLFDEPGTLETVASVAGLWFVEHLTPLGGTDAKVR